MRSLLLVFAILCLKYESSESFSVSTRCRLKSSYPRQSDTSLNGRSRSSSSSRSNDAQMRSKRQERVGQLVKTELAQIIQRGSLKLGASLLDDSIRQRISIVNVNVSPDLRHARVAVSILANPKSAIPASEEVPYNSAMDQRRAYSWLVSNTRSLRHALAQRISHMKICPDLTFHKVDVGAAVDVMFLIDQLQEGQKRTDLDFSDPKTLVPMGEEDGFMDEYEDIDDNDWEDDEDFF